MLTTLQGADEELELMDVSIQDIINAITLEDVQAVLEGLGVEQIAMYEDKGYIVCPTICHNPIEEAESMKLYWYQNNKIFRCYTECNEAMSIFTLYQKFMRINYHKVSFEEAVDYVKKCIKHLVVSGVKKYHSDFNMDKYKFDSSIPHLTKYPQTMLTYFPPYHHPLWLKDGIKPEIMDKFHIGFSLAQNKITIPHLDIDGNLVGIRARTLDKDEADQYGKYRPLQLGSVLYAHPLHFNLYGIYEHQEAIRKRQSAIIVEGEKSVLLDDGYYGQWANAVACCGSKINKYQINLLTNVLGANEITIAFDKEYTDWRTEKAREYRKRIEAACRKYTGQATFYYIWDMDNLLEEKDSPYDKGKEVFEELYKRRIRVR
jgi:hypothetical protein